MQEGKSSACTGIASLVGPAAADAETGCRIAVTIARISKMGFSFPLHIDVFSLSWGKYGERNIPFITHPSSIVNCL